MNLEEQTRRGRTGYEDARYQFILTELELALTFANIAISEKDNDRQQRNLRHARRAYDAASQRIDEQELPLQKNSPLRSASGN